jgi:hypothetical protein
VTARTGLLLALLAGLALAYAADARRDGAAGADGGPGVALHGAVGAPVGRVETAKPAAPATVPVAAPTGAPAPEPEIAALLPRGQAGQASDLFPPQDWRAPPSVPAAAAPRRAAPSAPPVPVAPPLPFTVLGKKLEDGRWEVFLATRERTYVVRESDTIERAYRVESIAPPALVLTYLPLGERQTLAIGDGR